MLALLAGFARLLVAVAGGWLVVNRLRADVPWLVAAIALACVLFGTLQALATNHVIRGRTA